MDKQMTLFKSSDQNKDAKKSKNKMISPEYAKECSFYNKLKAKKLNYRLQIFPSNICHSIYLFNATSNDHLGEQCEVYCKFDKKIKPNHFYRLNQSKMLRPTPIDLKQMQSLYHKVIEDSAPDDNKNSDK